jgi:hypothetical protein
MNNRLRTRRIKTVSLLGREVQESEDVMTKHILRNASILDSERQKRGDTRNAAANVETKIRLDRAQ